MTALVEPWLDIFYICGFSFLPMVLLTKESLTPNHTDKLLSIVQQKNLDILRYLDSKSSVCIDGSAAEHEEECNGGPWSAGDTGHTIYPRVCANTATAELPPDP